MVRYTSKGMVAQRDWVEEACRRRQMASISFGGRVLVLEMSRKEESVLMPGLGISGATRGAGGGGGKGDEEG
jgi:hypothetical protein